MSNERFQKMKFEKLKLSKVPWIQIKPTYIRPSSRFKSTNSKSCIIAKPIGQTTRSYFAHSSIQFTESEHVILRKAESDNEKTKNQLKLDFKIISRRPSKLQELQQSQNDEINSIDFNPTGRSQSVCHPSTNEQNIFETCDSFISLKSLVDEDDHDVEDDSKKIEKNPSDVQVITSGPVTTNDIKEHIWLYSHEVCQTNDNIFMPKYYADSMTEVNKRIIINKVMTKGQKKLISALNESSNMTNESEKLKNLFSNKEKALKESLENSYSAMKYTKYLHHNNLAIPDYIYDLHFSENNINEFKEDKV